MNAIKPMIIIYKQRDKSVVIQQSEEVKGGAYSCKE